jgi:hypothetical protein
VIASGTFTSATDFGNGVIANTDGTDVFVIGLSPSLSTLWSHGLGGAGADQPSGLVTFVDGSSAVLGSFTETFDAKVASLVSAGNTDAFLVDFAP